jgi:Transglutaminase-like superfamily
MSETVGGRAAPLSVPAKVALISRVTFLFFFVHIGLRRWSLPDLVERLRACRSLRSEPIEPVRLGRIVYRGLRIGSVRPRCLVNALILYRLLREQGDPADLVVGLPREPEGTDAHAWIEIRGVDVGPPPGRGPHEELVRY